MLGVAPSMRALGLAGIALGALVWAASTAAVSRPDGAVVQVAGKKGCSTRDGSSEDGANTCRRIRGGGQNTTTTLSPDARFAYIVGYGHTTVPVPVLSIFHRNERNGALTQLAGKKGCLSRDGSSEDGAGTCHRARLLDTGDGHSLAISRDGKFLYGASQASAAAGVTIFKRNRDKGTLHQLEG